MKISLGVFSVLFLISADPLAADTLKAEGRFSQKVVDSLVEQFDATTSPTFDILRILKDRMPNPRQWEALEELDCGAEANAKIAELKKADLDQDGVASNVALEADCKAGNNKEADSEVIVSRRIKLEMKDDDDQDWKSGFSFIESQTIQFRDVKEIVEVKEDVNFKFVGMVGNSRAYDFKIFLKEFDLEAKAVSENFLQGRLEVTPEMGLDFDRKPAESLVESGVITNLSGWAKEPTTTPGLTAILKSSRLEFGRLGALSANLGGIDHEEYEFRGSSEVLDAEGNIIKMTYEDGPVASIFYNDKLLKKTEIPAPFPKKP